MLISITTLNASGLRDWFVQRVTAVLLASYAILMATFIIKHSPMSYDVWHVFFSQTWVKIFTVFILFSLLFHAWIGMWIVSTDYLKKACVRITLQVVGIFALFASLLIGVMIVWGS